MSPKGERSVLKRNQPDEPDNSQDQAADSKKPRRSQRIKKNTFGAEEPVSPSGSNSPSPASPAKDALPPPPVPMREELTPIPSSPGPTQLEATQVASQFYCPPPPGDDAAAEEDPSAWGYLVPLNNSTDENRKTIKLNKSPLGTPQKSQQGTRKKGSKTTAAAGFLIGRHAECDYHIDSGYISNRHCILYKESQGNTFHAILEDLSSNGTWVNGVIVGRNHRRKLENGDEIEIAGGVQFVFRYPKSMTASKFRDEWERGSPLGSGHFATVYTAIERSTGNKYAVKVFTKRKGEDSTSNGGLAQEIAVLQSVSHPNVLGLKNSYDEEDGVYLVLELASGGELFNYIIENQKLSEDDTRHVFKQLFDGLKYLHDRNIVHRDIKPENILIAEKNPLHVKLADFGLAKIIGEESFTTSLCGTPSYVAPEILQANGTRKYDRAVDIWSLGVVLYICLCGFPPFSDELCTPENPYPLAEQIRKAMFDFPSPYWDSVGDAALDLIEHMLELNPGRRYSIDQCLEHPWISGGTFQPLDSFSSITNGINTLGFVRKKVERERTLLAQAPGLQNEHVPNPSMAPAVNAAVAEQGEGEGEEKELPISPRNEGTEESLDVNGKAFANIGGKGADETLFDGKGDVPEEQPLYPV